MTRPRGELVADGAREAFFVEQPCQRVVLVQEIGVVVVLFWDVSDFGRRRFAPVDEFERGDERRCRIDMQVQGPRRAFEELAVPELLLASFLVRMAGLVVDTVAASVIRPPDGMARPAILAGALRDVGLPAFVRVDDARELVFLPIGVEQISCLLQCQIHGLHDTTSFPNSQFPSPKMQISPTQHSALSLLYNVFGENGLLS